MADTRNFPFVWERMDAKAAAYIKELRTRQHMTWRGVAGECWDKFGRWWGEDSWDSIQTNQLIGQDLCVAAAEFMGEDPYENPWN